MGARHVVALLVGCVVGLGCGSPPPSAAPAQAAAPPAAPPAASARAPLGRPIDASAVATAVGVGIGDVEPGDAGTVKVSFPRTDVTVSVDAWKMPPFMGLTSWAAFGPAREGVAEAMVMGDLVLFEDEVSDVMSALLDGGIDVTALHNHFFFDQPRVYFLHIGGEGTAAALGRGVRKALDEVSRIRANTPKPAATFGAAVLPEKSALDPAALEAVLGVKGATKDGMYKIVVGREVTAACGCPAGKALGVSTWAAFAGEPANAVVDGDFAVTEAELQPVLKELRAGGVHVVAIHHHMSGETPRLLFLHYWGRGKAVDLAAVIRRALGKTSS
jgi:hypothetical protein